MSTRTPNRQRRKAERRQRNVWILGPLLIGAVALLAFAAIRMPDGVPLRAYKTYYATLPDIGNLQIRSEIRSRGVRIGQVLRTDSIDGQAQVELQIDSSAHEIPEDSRVRVRGQGLLGQRYLEVVPGKSTAGAADGQSFAPTAEYSVSSGLPDVLDTFDPATRRGLSDVLHGLGDGLASRGDGLNRALSVSPEAGQAFIRAMDTVLEDRPAVRRLVPMLSAGMGALDSARDDIVAMLDPAADTLDAMSASRVDLQGTLSELPPTLDAARPGLAAGTRLLDAADTLARGAAHTLPKAPGGLRAATALLRDSRGPLVKARGLLDAAKPAVPALIRVTNALDPQLRPIRELSDDVLPLVRVVGARGCDLDNFAENWRSTLGYGIPTANGGTPLPSGRLGNDQAFRITVVAGAQSLTGGLASGVAPNLVTPEPYPRACAYSPGPVYPKFVEGGSR